MKEELKNILESSLLEEYLLGLCSDEESRRVEQYIEKYPEVRAEYELLQDNIEQYARQLATPAPAGLKAQVLDEIDRLSGAAAAPPPPPPPVVEMRRPWWAVAAAVAALAFALGSFFFWQQSNELRAEKQALQADFDQLKASCEEDSKLMAGIQQQLEFLQAPATSKYLLQGNQLAAGLSVAAYWNEEEQRNLINVLNLPPLPNNQCYQLWADVDGEMLNLGILPKGQDTFQELTYLANTTSLNLTIEPEGGSDHPTVSRLVANIFI